MHKAARWQHGSSASRSPVTVLHALYPCHRRLTLSPLLAASTLLMPSPSARHDSRCGIQQERRPLEPRRSHAHEACAVQRGDWQPHVRLRRHAPQHHIRRVDTFTIPRQPWRSTLGGSQTRLLIPCRDQALRSDSNTTRGSTCDNSNARRSGGGDGTCSSSGGGSGKVSRIADTCHSHDCNCTAIVFTAYGIDPVPPL